MMKANELRIGNLLQGGKVLNFDNCIVKFKDKLHYVYGINHPLCRPIPLTEEWLLKFGFEKTIHSWYHSSNLPIYICPFPVT